jgi:hypothetical protein
VQVTLARPDAGADTHPTPATHASTVHGSPSSHTERPAVSQSAAGGSVVVVVGCRVVVGDVVDVLGTVVLLVLVVLLVVVGGAAATRIGSLSATAVGWSK